MRNPSALDCPLLALLALFAALLPGTALTAEEDTTGAVYRTPAPVLVDMVDAPPTPDVRPSPDGEWLLVAERPSLPPIDELARRELRLAGLRIDPSTHGPSRGFYYSGLSLVPVAGGETRPLTGLPPESRIGRPTFSPDGARIGFTHTAEERIELWVADVATARARRLADVRLSLAASEYPRWLPDSTGLLAALVPEGLGPEPGEPAVPKGPVIQESSGRKAPARTYQDLLKDGYDEALFEHYFTARLARVGLDGAVTPLGEPGILWSFDPSPDGRYLLVEWLHRPFSYLVPAFRFPRRVEVWSADGLLVRSLADLPLHDDVPIAFGSVPTGPREHRWRSDAPATVVWAEALDGGDAAAEAEVRDRLFLLAAPFEGDGDPLLTLELRYGGAEWASDGLALVTEWWWPTRRRRVWRVRPGHAGAEGQADAEAILDYSWEDRYHHPGSPLTRTDARGREVLVTTDDGGTIFLVGDGASPEGDRPFLDAFDLEARTTERLFRSEAPYYERPLELLDEPGAGTPAGLLTRRESVEEPPNVFLRRLSAAEAGEPRRLTDFPHPTPQLLGVYKELVRYRRSDGVELTATLYLPPGKTPEDGPFPLLLWAYPQEFKSADAASQVTDSPHRFVRVGWYSPLLFLARGYALLDDPGMPIVGEGEEEPNDTYVEQLVDSARSAVDEMVRRGVAERGRIAVGGHSYGAFMTANLLAHSDLFAAGIARSGAYNRTLTPFGFQAEERTVWQAPDVYVTMSPFLHAARVNEPILLIHGDADNNSGTFPIQSERFYSALKGLGGTVRLVMLPLESHGYRARESVFHVLWEMDRWLELHLAEPAEDAPGG